MPRPSSQQKTPVAKAIVGLRAKLGETQPEFAERLGLAPQTLARWETKLPPTGRMLVVLWTLADEIGLTSIGDIFRDAYLRDLEERDGVSARFQSGRLVIQHG